MFDNAFFDDEIRDGYPVNTMMKRGWAASLEVLREVDRICKKYDIQYYAEWGTLLGTVRHHGFIPWDDDLDISMKRADYNRFLEIVEGELPQGYTVHHVKKQDKHGAALCGIFNTYGYNTEKEFIDKYHGCPAAIGIDVVALDYYPRDKKEQEQQAEALDFLYSLIAQYDGLSTEEKKHQLQLVEKTLGKKIDDSNPNMSVTYQLGVLLEDICQLYGEEDADELTNMMVWQHWKEYHTPKERYSSVVMGDFEGFTMPMPVGYDQHLRINYGEYMNMVRTGSSHNYPYFEGNYIKAFGMIGGAEYLPNQMPLPREKCVNKSGEKELILILVSQVEHWKDMRPTWERLCAEEVDSADIYIMPLPYYRKDVWGNVIEVVYDGNKFPDGLPLVDYQEYELAGLRPDRIYYQDPWDEWGETVEMADEYKSDALWSYCERLILVPSNQPTPYGSEDERAAKMLNYMVRYPGFLVADQIDVENVELRHNYADALAGFTGEATRRIWNSKLGID